MTSLSGLIYAHNKRVKIIIIIISDVMCFVYDYFMGLHAYIHIYVRDIML